MRSRPDTVDPRRSGPTAPNARGPAILLGLAATAYVVALALVGYGLVPRSWGLDPLLFLPPATRALILAVAAGGLALVWSGAASGLPEPNAAKARRAPPELRRSAPYLALAGGSLLLWLARDRSHFLGDGRVWIDNFTANQFPRYSEPLAVAVWEGFVRLLRTVGAPLGADTFALLPIACGLAAGILLWRIAGELAPTRAARLASFGLLVSLGSTMLYCGYIEVYPIVSLAVLGYLLLGLRGARGAVSPVVVAAGLAVATAAHLLCVYLVPSCVYLVRRARLALWKQALLVAGIASAVWVGFVLLGYPLREALRPFGILSVALRSGGGSPPSTAASALAPFSDLASALLLVLPVPCLLLLARAAAGRTDEEAGRAPGRIFLLLAASSGALAALVLAVPGSPSQDWDLLAVAVLPVALLGIREGLTLLRDAPDRVRAGLIAISLAGLGAFVLVNAGERTAEARLASLVGSGARLTPHERAYGNEKLARAFMARRDFAAALPHARASFEAEPGNARYATNLGHALSELGRTGEAIPLLKRAVAMAPERWDARYDLGLCYSREERYAEAADALGSAVAAGADRPDVHHLWGLALYRSGHADSAVTVWRNVLARWPEYSATLQGSRFRDGAPAP